jgi:cellulose biosynthesis protein BcsQ
MSNLDKIIARQEAYYATDAKVWKKSGSSKLYPNIGALLNLGLPRYSIYSVCNLRGGIGKTTLAFNLSFDTNDVLAVDTCPQGNLSAFYDPNYYGAGVSIYDALLPYIVPGLGHASRISRNISATNGYFQGKIAYFISSSPNLYEFPSTLEGAISQTRGLPPAQSALAKTKLLLSLKEIVSAAMKDTNTKRCLIDTSPFFSGATHLSWHAADALLVPVRTDQQSMQSLELLLQMLSDPARSFLKTKNGLDLPVPKIQLILVTHCGWSTKAGSRHNPNNQTRAYLEKVRDIVSRNIIHFTTHDPDNHIVPIDDFLGSGRISSAKAMPIKEMTPGFSSTINSQRVEVNASVEKCKKQISFITTNIW